MMLNLPKLLSSSLPRMLSSRTKFQFSEHKPESLDLFNRIM